jgi:flagellar hook-length control protein FliK
LKPEHLGELTLKVTVENGAVSASFHSNNSEVRTIIEASLTQLKQELSTQGLKVENVGVYAGLNQSFSNEQQQQAAQQQQIKFKNRRQDESFINAIEAAAVLPATSDAGVDYRI